jgi:hypothetical protein
MYLTKPKSEVEERVVRMKECGLTRLTLKYHESGRRDIDRPKQRWINEETLQD